MKIVETVDDSGRKRRWGLNKGDDPKEAPEIGIDLGVPDLSLIDWDAVSVALSNKLYSQGVFTPEDVLLKGNAVASAVQSTVTKALIKLYGV